MALAVLTSTSLLFLIIGLIQGINITLSTFMSNLCNDLYVISSTDSVGIAIDTILNDQFGDVWMLVLIIMIH